MRRCSHDLKNRGLPYPRTCQVCGLGACKYSLQGITGVQVLQPPRPGEVIFTEHPDSFAHIPQSITEVRAEKEARASARTVRDMLIDILRKIDSGDPSYQNLEVGMILTRRAINDKEWETIWHGAGPEFGMLTGLGLLARIMHLFNGD